MSFVTAHKGHQKNGVENSHSILIVDYVWKQVESFYLFYFFFLKKFLILHHEVLA